MDANAHGVGPCAAILAHLATRCPFPNDASPGDDFFRVFRRLLFPCERLLHLLSIGKTREGIAMELGKRKCVPCEGGATTLPAGEVNRMLSQLSGWQVEPGVSELRKRFKFATFLDTMAFVNRMADRRWPCGRMCRIPRSARKCSTRCWLFWGAVRPPLALPRPLLHSRPP